MAEHATSPCPLPLPVLLLLLLLLLLTLMASAQPTYATVDTSTAARAFCCCRGTVESPKTYASEGWAGGSSSFYRSDLPPSRYLVTARLLYALPLPPSRPLVDPLVSCRASSPTSARPGLSRVRSCSTSLIRWLRRMGVPGARCLAPKLFCAADASFFCPRGGALAVCNRPPPSAALTPDAAPPPFTCPRPPQNP